MVHAIMAMIAGHLVVVSTETSASVSANAHKERVSQETLREKEMVQRSSLKRNENALVSYAIKINLLVLAFDCLHAISIYFVIQVD